MLPTILLPLGGGALLYWWQRQRSSTPLIEALTPAVPTAPAVQAVAPLTPPALQQKLALSLSLLGIATVGRWVVPFGPLLTAAGLLYLDLHFIRLAYHEWRLQRRVSVALNDAILVTGLLVTHQLAAGSLFVTLFFVGCKLQTQAEKELAYYLSTTTLTTAADERIPASGQPRAVSGVEAAVEFGTPDWQATIDQASLPLLLLAAVSTPWLGLSRALAILLTNFGYDYRLTAPLSTLTYLKTMNGQGIWLRYVHVLDELQRVEVVVLDVRNEATWLAALVDRPYTVVGLHQADRAGDPAVLVTQLRQQGRYVAYVSDCATAAEPPVAANLLIALPGSSLIDRGMADVVLAEHSVTHFQQLFHYAAALQAMRQRGLYIALGPSLLNLGGIYLGGFGVITALLVDYGSTVAGVANALWPVQLAPVREAGQLAQP